MFIDISAYGAVNVAVVKTVGADTDTAQQKNPQ
jgi:hypothetical protein